MPCFFVFFIEAHIPKNEPLMEKIFGKPDSAAGKELVSTTIVNETYGTFELSANSMCLNMAEISNNLLYANGTDFNYLIESWTFIKFLICSPPFALFFVVLALVYALLLQAHYLQKILKSCLLVYSSMFCWL